VETGCTVEALEADAEGGWRLRIGDTTRHARFVILATGLRDPVAATLDPGQPAAGMGLALELEAPPDRAAPTGGLQVEIGAHPGGWFWLCPLGRRYTAGLVSTRVRVPGARRLLNLFLERRGLAASGVLSSATDLIAGAAPGSRPVRPGLIPVGDLLPAGDPLTGLGLDGAMQSGLHAADLVARAALESGPEPAAAMEAWRQGAVRQVRAAVRVGEAVHRRPARFLEAIRSEPARAAELGACLVGGTPYAELFGRWWPTPFQRMVRALLRGT
jgi:flavin-dependent dehydrogenase